MKKIKIRVIRGGVLCSGLRRCRILFLNFSFFHWCLDHWLCDWIYGHLSRLRLVQVRIVIQPSTAVVQGQPSGIRFHWFRRPIKEDGSYSFLASRFLSLLQKINSGGARLLAWRPCTCAWNVEQTHFWCGGRMVLRLTNRTLFAIFVRQCSNCLKGRRMFFIHQICILIGARLGFLNFLEKKPSPFMTSKYTKTLLIHQCKDGISYESFD